MQTIEKIQKILDFNDKTLGRLPKESKNGIYRSDWFIDRFCTFPAINMYEYLHKFGEWIEKFHIKTKYPLSEVFDSV